MKLSIVLPIQPAQFQAATFQGDLEKNLSHIASLGYDGVELAIRDPKLVDLEALDKLIHQYGLRVPAIGTGQAWGEEGLSFTDPDRSIRSAGIERIKRHMQVADHFHALIIIGLIRGTLQPGVEPAQAMGWLVEALHECSESAQAHNLRLALEPINRYETALINNTAQALELIERVNAPNLGLLLDTFHMNIEEAVIQDSLCCSAARLFHFHVADSNRWYPGAGHLDFKSILGTLRESGYRGWLSGEFLPLPDAETAAQKGIVYLRQSA